MPSVRTIYNVMPMKHPHADATYRVVSHLDSAYAVEVTIPASNPTLVTSFATVGDAETWIARHRARVAESTQQHGGQWRRRPKPQPAQSEESP
jgi:hypothetical protein